jgi:RNA polymerase sigma-70 factor, ECF subfamily
LDASVTFRFPALPLSTKTAASQDVHPSATIVEPSDEALIGQVCEGSADALAVLFRRHARTVRGVAFRVVRDASEADDLLQDVFLLVHRLCNTFDNSKGPARFWILQMTYRRAISRRRYLASRHFYTGLDLNEAAADLPDPRTDPTLLDDAIDARIESNRVQVKFADLSHDQQRTLRLFFMEGYTLDEIATKLGHSRGNVKNHYFRGLEKLRKALFGTKLPGERAV